MSFDANAELLFKQAPKTVTDFFESACHIVASKFGDESVASCPELIGQLVRAMSTDYATTMISKALSELTETIGAFEFVVGS